MITESSTRRRPRAAAFVATATLLTAAVAGAEPLRVTAIPWVQENPDIPHPAVNGQPTMLQAIAEGGDCGGRYRFRWDVNGDGDFDDFDGAEGWRDASAGGDRNGYFAPLGLDVRLPAARGDTLVFPKVEVACGEATEDAVMPVEIRVDRICGSLDPRSCGDAGSITVTRRVLADRAVDRALWWLFNRFVHRTSDGVHTCWINDGRTLFNTGNALNALLRRGHGHGEGRDRDPYYRHATQCGLHRILEQITYGNVRHEDVNDLGRDGQGAFLNWSSHQYSYEATAWVEPIAQFGNPAYQSPIGPTRGQTLRAIGQDAADTLVHCQNGQGWWHYSCRQGGIDASTNGWPPEALRLLERRLGVETYDWAKDNQRRSLNQYCDHRGCYYGSWRVPLAGNGLTGYGWTQDQRFDPDSRNMAGLLEAVQRINHTGAGYYYMFATTKGLRAFVPEIRYLPNGRDWNQEFTDFLVPRQRQGGYWDDDPSYVNRAGTAGETAIATQIIQSWLEVQAWAQAVPELAGPGIDITFDHSWSHVLDPTVSIRTYRWNVVDYPQGHDANGDGDFDDEGDHAPEDRDGDGEVSVEEIVWDFETDDPNERFVYAYQADLGWDEIETHVVTLAVVDDRGRVVYDTDSVQIQLSLRNHVPVIVPHPEGLGHRYTGYVGTRVQLDGRRSYDPDTEHEVFPGDDDRPAGVRDRVTSIHFDLNLDGDFDDAGEDGTGGPVLLTLREGMAEGDLLSVPMRVCDDGQWNGKCYDGVTRPDCSECAYGSAPVQLVRNVRPPAIDPGRDPYVSNLRDPVELDLTGTRDPEGVLGLRYRYEIVEGRGELRPTPGYEDVEDDMGPRPRYVPAPDGPRVDRIRATVTDGGGLSSEAILRVQVPNRPPAIAAWDLELEGRTPQVGPLRVENLGNGRYRAVLEARPDPAWDGWLRYQATDPGGDDLVAMADMDADGRFDVRGEGDAGRLGPFALAGGQAHRIRLRIFDGDDADMQDRAFDVPPVDPTLRFFFDLGADGRYEVVGGGENHFEFAVPAGTEEVVVAGEVRGVGGDGAPFEQRVVLGNEAPVFELARLLGRDGFTVVAVASAVDPDGDDVTYVFDWGDGSEATRNRGGLADHAYPDGRFARYTLTIAAEDGRGGRAERRLEVDFPRPPENRAPAIDAVRVIKEGGFDVLLVTAARDPDGDALSYRVDWGDGSPATVVGNGIAVHTYPDGRFEAYEITVTVTDGRGGEAVERARVDFPPPAEDAPPVVGDVSVSMGARGLATVTVEAWDPEGGRLRYAIHWGDEDDPEATAPMPGGTAGHRYALPEDDAAYEAFVVVTDDGGATTRRDFEVAVRDRPTQVRGVVASLIREGTWLFTVLADDPDGADQLVHDFDFQGDGEWDVTGSVAPSIVHTYDEPGTYTVRVRITDPWSGASTEAETEIELHPWQPDNAPPVIDGVRAEHVGRGLVRLVVEAVDPEGERLDAVVHWGDEEDPEALSPLAALRGEHRYAFVAGGDPYRGHVRVTDARGATVRRDFEVAVEDGPTVIREITTHLLREGTWMFTVLADDPDGRDQLVYSFDFQDDGEWDLADRPLATTVHTFGGAGPHTVRVAVRDTWSNARVEGQVQVGGDDGAEVNQPPVIHEVRTATGPAGHAEVVVAATDPEGGRLTAEIAWGDGGEPEALPDLRGEHAYDFPADGAPYRGRVVVTDGRGARAEATFEIAVADHPTVIRGVSVSVIRDGRVLIDAVASDPDSDSLLYAFDVDADGTIDVPEQPEGSAFHTYDEGGSYDLVVAVTDPWSGVVTTAEHKFELPAWVDEVPVADDHLEGEEGRCLVFRIGGEDGDLLSTKVDPGACERDENPGPHTWRWDFGDGATATGSEVGHRYADDGIYDVVVEGGPPERPRRSGLQAFIANVAPAFLSQPTTAARAGERYEYSIVLEDPGVTDEIRLRVVDGPEGLFLERGGTDRAWRLEWAVPDDFADARVAIELRAFDGHTVGGEWVPDDGTATQRFELAVEGRLADDLDPLPGEGPDASLPQADAGPDAGASPGIGADAYTGSSCNCDFTGGAPASTLLLALLGLAGLRRRR